MEEQYFREFKKRIYEYCDNNVRKKVLLTGFMNLLSTNHDVAPKDLAILTSKINNDLIKKGILKEVPKPKNSDVPYGMYEILPHERLIEDDKTKRF